jgi:Carboxypeptidase regulatory-like domain/TonB dependent receptor
MRFHPRALAVMVLVLGLASPVFGQIDQGRLTGTVTDSQGAVLPGVTVTARSPALMGVRTVVSEADGSYSIAALPSGDYELTFELTGFTTFKRGNLRIGLGQILTVDAQLQVAALQESVTVSAASPVVDMQNTKVGTDFTTDKLVGVPTATDIWAVLGQAAGVRMTGFDVGGSHKSQQSGYESFGIRNQNRVLNNGIDTTEGTGAAGFYADYFANEEVAVSAAGGDVEMNTPGSAVISTIKSGGNTFKGLETIAYQPKEWVGDNIDATTRALGFTGQPNIKFWEGHWDLGGPIKRDRAWFYGAANRFVIDKIISGVDPAVATDLGKFWNYTTKETVKASQNNTFVGYLQRGLKEKPKRGLSATVSPESAQPQASWSWIYQGEWQHVATNRLFVNVKGGLFGYDFPLLTLVDAKTAPPRINNNTFITGAAWNAFDLGRQKPQVTAQSTYFVPDKAGSHDLKVGFEYLLDIAKYTLTGASGTTRYYDVNGQPDEVQFVDVGEESTLGSSWRGGNDRNLRYAAYFQDRWNIAGRATVTAGVRWDHQRPYYLDGVRDPLMKDVLGPSSGALAGQPIFRAQTTPGQTIFTRDSIAPRLGVSYDVTGSGNSVLKAFWGRYYFNYADSFTSLNPGGANYKRFRFNDLNGDRLYSGPQELGTLVSSSGGSSTTVDPNLEKPYADELDLSFERQFWGESSARVAYIRKQTHNEFQRVDISRLGRFTVPVTFTQTLREYVNGRAETVVGQQTFNLFDLPDRPTPVNQFINVPEGAYNFDTVQFAFNKRFRTGLFVQTSFDYQWRDELRGGTTAGGTPINVTTSPLNSDPIGVGFFLNPYPTVPNRQETTNWQGRLMGRYVFKYDLGVATNLRVQSGYPHARIMTQALPNAGSMRFYIEPLKNNRSDTTPILDLRVDKAFPFGRYKVSALFELFNLANSNAVTNGVLTNGSFNQIIATLDPRVAQFGIRFDF